jgi:hypothetical protein
VTLKPNPSPSPLLALTILGLSLGKAQAVPSDTTSASLGPFCPAGWEKRKWREKDFDGEHRMESLLFAVLWR